MKKICLSIDQMRQLKELGVETKDASMVLMFFTEDGEELSWDQVENHGKDKPLWEWFNEETEIWEPARAELFDAETGSYDHSYREECGVFTLQDMIEMMPTITNHDGWLLKDEHGEYKVSYKKSMDSAIIGTHYWDNPLDAAFDMLVWLAKHGYLKGGKK